MPLNPLKQLQGDIPGPGARIVVEESRPLEAMLPGSSLAGFGAMMTWGEDSSSAKSLQRHAPYFLRRCFFTTTLAGI